MNDCLWYVYLLKSAKGRYYIGITLDIARRLRQHNGEIKGGAKATRTGRPWKIVYIEEVNGRGKAQSREYVLKKLSHSEKSELYYG